MTCVAVEESSSIRLYLTHAERIISAEETNRVVGNSQFIVQIKEKKTTYHPHCFVPKDRIGIVQLKEHEIACGKRYGLIREFVPTIFEVKEVKVVPEDRYLAIVKRYQEAEEAKFPGKCMFGEGLERVLLEEMFGLQRKN
ncbi:MAG: hypothetical protein AABX72_04390 [Nanoarchaeota archaeon]